MGFRLKRDAEAWFSRVWDVNAPGRTKFDIYYLCLMLGLAAGRRTEPTEAPEFVDYVVSDYKPVHRLVIGLLIIAELRRLGISLSEKEDVQRRIRELVDPEAPSNLTEEGLKLLNEYASGGYDYLAESTQTKPYYLEVFVRTYVEIVDEAIGQAIE